MPDAEALVVKAASAEYAVTEVIFQISQRGFPLLCKPLAFDDVAAIIGVLTPSVFVFHDFSSLFLELSR